MLIGGKRLVRENLEMVRKNIAAACKRAGRDVSEVTLLAVSKTKPISLIEDAIQCGQKEFGENKVQEIVNKYEEIADESIKWHMIGHLQTNKVKYIIDKVDLIHSVDSMKLAKVISAEAQKRNVIANILIEVNVAKEDSKFGIMLEETEEYVRNIALLPNINIRGLMTIAPFVIDSEQNRIHFKKLYKEFIDINSKNIDNVNMDVLPMGMTNDYEVAIEEGATIVRVGTVISGVR